MLFYALKEGCCMMKAAIKPLYKRLSRDNEPGEECSSMQNQEHLSKGQFPKEKIRPMNCFFYYAFINPIQWQSNETHQEQMVYKKIRNPDSMSSVPQLHLSAAIHILQAFPILMQREKYIL